ncbi:hypothetical protein P7C73_g3984, partial [Tremellales sp. Uapishka_1]
MTSVHLSSSFDNGHSRPQSQAGHISPAESPRIQRPPSQPALHLPPGGNYSPLLGHDSHPMSAYPSAHAQPYRPYQPTSLSLPPPQMYSGYPSSAPPMPYYNTPLFDSRMMRSVSHAHPLHSASDQTASRYSESPHSAGMQDAPPTASQPYPPGPPYGYTHEDGRHGINTSLLSGGGYAMSRSTSGGSDTPAEMNSRLLTPHYEGYPRNGDGYLIPTEQELRKVSDSLGGSRGSSGRFFPNSMGYDHPVPPHPQPDHMFYNRGYPFDHFAVSAERGDTKPDIALLQGDTPYERARNSNIEHNRKLLNDLGLEGQQPVGGLPTLIEARSAEAEQQARSRPSSAMGGGSHRKLTTPKKRLLSQSNPVRASPRIASMSRNVSYADLDGGPVSEVESEGEDEFSSDLGDIEEDEEEFRPAKRSKGSRNSYSRKPAPTPRYRQEPRAPLSLFGLLEVYPEIPQCYPLFYYTLNNDLSINSDAVQLIGSIPSTYQPPEKAATLADFFHRGRRVLAQLDAFTARCDRKYEGPLQKWPELDFHHRLAVRDVRRKVVERTENYKYTRRDILDKHMGKNKWPPIEDGMIEWRSDMAENDPAGDLRNVTLTLPTPPPGYQPRGLGMRSHGRAIRDFPVRRMVSAGPAPRNVSIQMADADNHPYMMSSASSQYTYPPLPPPMYGEDQVPMTVQMPHAPNALAAPAQPWAFERPPSQPRGTSPKSGEEDEQSEGGEGQATGFEESHGQAQTWST